MRTPEFSAACPVPFQNYANVLMAHGGGGKLMHDLIGEVFLPAFGGNMAGAPHDASVIEVGRNILAFTTDSYVVRPLFFPGGDIGSMAVNGTVNDLAMAGARPLALSAAFIIEEGLEMGTLRALTVSMRRAADEANVKIVTGDTKVVERGKGDGVFITTAGIGQLDHGLAIRPESIRDGDAVLVSGDLGRHGITILSARESLTFESAIKSDSAPVSQPVLAMLDAGLEIHCLRDITRGGLTTVLNELAQGSNTGVVIEEARIPVGAEVRAACELLGLDPLQVACEGRFVAILPEAQATKALRILRGFEVTAQAVLVGHVRHDASPRVLLQGILGTTRVLDVPSGEQLPRIC